VAQTPCYHNDERSVEKSGLDRCTENMGEGEVHLIIPGFVNGCDVLGSFFDHGYEDKTNKTVDISMISVSNLDDYLRILDVMLLYDVFDLLDEEDSHEYDHSNSKSNGNNAFGCSQFSFVGISVLVGVLLLVSL
jgi:hypothetical protein